MYKYLFFDLDGTLLDTYPGVSRSLYYMLEALGMPIPDEEETRRYLGPPLRDSFINIAGIEEKNMDAAMSKFRERYDSKGVYEYSFFEDLPAALDALSDKGYTLCVATSKIEHAAVRMLRHAGIYDKFSVIGGSIPPGESHSKEPARVTKAQVIEHVIECVGIENRAEILMIGDRENDVLGAKAAGIDCCGVLCGYGDREELENAGAKLIVENIGSLTKIL